MTRGQDTYYYMAGGLGSIRNLLDASEAVVSTYDYYAFGDELSATEVVVCPYRFTAREREPGGLSHAHFYRNRYYMPGVGLFMSRDAKAYDRARGFQYVRNNPVHYIDPTGLVGEPDPPPSGSWIDWDPWNQCWPPYSIQEGEVLLAGFRNCDAIPDVKWHSSATAGESISFTGGLPFKGATVDVVHKATKGKTWDMSGAVPERKIVRLYGIFECEYKLRLRRVPWTWYYLPCWVWVCELKELDLRIEDCP